MSLLFPRSSSHAPMHHEFGPFFNLFNDTFSELQRLSDTVNAQASWVPKFDVKETKDAYTVEGELPGVEQKDITIEFTDDQTLAIKGRTEHHREEGERPPTDAEEVKEGEANQGEKPSMAKEVATTGTTEVAAGQPKHTYWLSERSVGTFQRSFSFPNKVDHNSKASLKNGILTIVIPKMQKQNTTRRINIE